MWLLKEELLLPGINEIALWIDLLYDLTLLWSFCANILIKDPIHGRLSRGALQLRMSPFLILIAHLTTEVRRRKNDTKVVKKAEISTIRMIYDRNKQETYCEKDRIEVE